MSELPDEILSFTLSFLPVREAARTGILSCRWRYLWTTSRSFCSTLTLDALNMRGSHYPEGMYKDNTSLLKIETSNVNFKGYTYEHDASKSKGKKDIDGNDCTYSQICQPLHESLLSAGVQLSSNQMVDNVLHELLQNGDAVRYGGGIGNKKLDGWLHLDSVAKRDPEAIRKAKDLKSHLKRCTRHMSMKQHKKCGSFDLPQELHKYELFEPMHELWKDYILKLTKNIGDIQQIAQRLLSADLHGAILQVVESKVTSFTGVRGIMVRETAETFGVNTLENKFRVVPKRGSIFLLRADCWKITMQGDEFVRKKI
ncbi:ribonuclease P [Ranunculus cassubicifolius]